MPSRLAGGTPCLPAALAPLFQVRALGAEGGVVAVPGVHPGAVGQPSEELRHDAVVQRPEALRVLLRVADLAGEAGRHLRVNTTEMPRAWLYGRISEDTTGEALGIARQIEAGRELAITRGWCIVGESIDNDISALRGAYRPGYEEVPRIVREGQVDYVVCWQTSRLLRNRRERADAIELFGRQRVGIIAVKGISFDLTTAYGRGQAGLMGEFDTMESEVKAERVAAAAAQRAHDGRPSGDLGCGWIVEGTGSSATYRVDQHQAGVVREIIDRLLSGETLRSITQSLNDRAEPAPKIPTWGKTSVKRSPCGNRTSAFVSITGASRTRLVTKASGLLWSIPSSTARSWHCSPGRIGE